MIDDLIQEQASLYVLDLLDAGEKAVFETRLRTDAKIRAFVDELREAAASVSHASPRRELPDGFEQRVLAAIDESEQIIPFRKPVPWIPWAIAAALAVVCTLLYSDLRNSSQAMARTSQDLEGSRMALIQSQSALIGSRNALAESQHTLADSRNALTEAQSALAAAQQSPELKLAVLGSKITSSPQANAVVVWDAKHQQGLVRLNGAPVLAAGRDYQLWVIDPDHKLPVSAGVIHADASQGAVVFHAALPVRDIQKFAISVEKEGGATEPGGPIVFISD